MAQRVSYRVEGLDTEAGSAALQRRLATLPGVRIENVRVGLPGDAGEIALIVDIERTTDPELRAMLSAA